MDKKLVKNRNIDMELLFKLAMNIHPNNIKTQLNNNVNTQIQTTNSQSTDINTNTNSTNTNSTDINSTDINSTDTNSQSTNPVVHPTVPITVPITRPTISTNTQSDYCSHENVVDEMGCMICVECGSEISKNSNFEKEWRYYGSNDNNHKNDPSRCHFRKNNEKSIFKDVDGMGFPYNIVSKANNLFEIVTNGEIFRGNSRKAIIFACIFHSFKNNGLPKSLEYLQTKFNLKRKVISKGMNHFGMNIKKKCVMDYKCISPETLIPEIMNKLSPDDDCHVENVLELYAKIKNRSSLLNRSKPQSITSGLIWFYCVYTKKSISIKELAKVVQLSEATIEKISKEVDVVLKTKLFTKKKKRGRIPKNKKLTK